MNPDDVPTGQISAQLIADAVAEADGAAGQASEDLERLRDERATLIQLCLYALDRARSGGVVFSDGGKLLRAPIVTVYTALQGGQR